MSQIAAVKIIEIPELAFLVLQHLTRPDFVACALVNRAWHGAIIPYLYQTVTVRERHDQKPSDDASWDGFQKYSSHIRELRIDSGARRDIALFGFNCTQLTSLQLQFSENTPQNAQWPRDLLKLISSNPGISALCLASSGGDSPVNEFDYHLVVLGILRYMPRLKKLVMIGTSMTMSSIDEILRCAYRLEELDLAMDRIDEDPTFRPSRSHLGFDFDSYLADLCLKDHDDVDAVDTSDGPYILDSQFRRCRQGTRLKKFSLKLRHRFRRGVPSRDGLGLVRLCCSAESIQLGFKEGRSRNTALLILGDQFWHPAWCLKHLDIGYGNSSVLPMVLRASPSSLVSFRLANAYLSAELLSALLSNHRKTLERVVVGKCPEIRIKTVAEALMSRCPNLRSLDIFDCESEGDLRMVMVGGRQARWVGPDDRVFKLFTSDQSPLASDRTRGTYNIPIVTMEAESTVQEDAWKHLDIMLRHQALGHIRFVAN
ncbi:hypothetical protein BGZ72_010872 [Mortierella alpina]|nr:hypothetical protein BGZ72_010872 [Mortierella alpina]